MLTTLTLSRNSACCPDRVELPRLARSLAGFGVARRELARSTGSLSSVRAIIPWRGGEAADALWIGLVGIVPGEGELPWWPRERDVDQDSMGHEWFDECGGGPIVVDVAGLRCRLLCAKVVIRCFTP